MPSTMATSASREAHSKILRFASPSSSQLSRLRAGRPHNALWWPGSRKSGPHLNGWRTLLRPRNAAISARATVILLTPLAVPATTNAIMIQPASDLWDGSQLRYLGQFGLSAPKEVQQSSGPHSRKPRPLVD